MNRLLNLNDVANIEERSTIKISNEHKIVCVCCGGSKIFREKICNYCDDNGMMSVQKANNFGILKMMFN